MSADRVGAFFSERTPRRVLAIAALLGLVVLFRGMMPLLVFFVAFQRALSAAARALASRARLSHRASVFGVTAFVLAVVAAGSVLGAGSALRHVAVMRDTFPHRVAALKEHPLYLRVRTEVGDTDHIVDQAHRYSTEALHAASEAGHILVYLTIALILAVVYLLEEEHLAAFRASLEPRSLSGTLVRWIGHLADAVVVTVQLQLIVAACNAALTLPVLLLLGIHHIAPLMVLIFVSGLIPVVGNFVSGAVLTLLAYQAHGAWGAAVFVTLTVVLHKIESYYLNPRLTARHVALPSFVLIVSLLAWEHLLGFVGLFVSFPFLFVAGKIRAELRAEEAEDLERERAARLV